MCLYLPPFYCLCCTHISLSTLKIIVHKILRIRKAFKYRVNKILHKLFILVENIVQNLLKLKHRKICCISWRMLSWNIWFYVIWPSVLNILATSPCLQIPYYAHKPWHRGSHSLAYARNYAIRTRSNFSVFAFIQIDKIDRFIQIAYLDVCSKAKILRVPF